MDVSLIGILNDGSTPSRALPATTRRALEMGVAETVDIDLSLFSIGGSPLDYAALDNPLIVFTLKKQTSDNPPFVSRAAVPNLSAGRNRVRITVFPKDTQFLLPGRYVYDIWLQTGTSVVARNPLVPLSPLALELTANQVNQAVTVPSPLPLTVFNLPTPGASGTVLTSEGPASAPAWGPPPSLLSRIIAMSMIAPAFLLFSGAVVGMKVVSVVGIRTVGFAGIVDYSSEFESVISIAGHIRQTSAASLPDTGNVSVLLST